MLMLLLVVRNESDDDAGHDGHDEVRACLNCTTWQRTSEPVSGRGVPEMSGVK